MTRLLPLGQIHDTVNPSVDTRSPKDAGTNQASQMSQKRLKKYRNDSDTLSYQLQTYIANGIELPDRMKEIHKIYAPKAYDFLVNHAKSQRVSSLIAKNKKHTRYISEDTSEDNRHIRSTYQMDKLLDNKQI